MWMDDTFKWKHCKQRKAITKKCRILSDTFRGEGWIVTDGKLVIMSYRFQYQHHQLSLTSEDIWLHNTETRIWIGLLLCSFSHSLIIYISFRYFQVSLLNDLIPMKITHSRNKSSEGCTSSAILQLSKNACSRTL